MLARLLLSSTLLAPSAADAEKLRQRSWPTLRIGFGGAYAPRVPAVAGASPTVSGFTLDVTAGAVIEVHKRVFLWPELGYNFTAREDRGGHFFTAGLAPMFGQRLAMVGVGPRLVVGNAWGTPGAGVRSGLIGSFGLNILSVELGHQWLRAGGRDLHEGRFMISIDLVGAFKVVLVLGIARALFR